MDTAVSYNNIGTIEERMGNYSIAKELFEKGLKITIN